jgi:ABC-type multidrug transport system ATPase subunit
MLSVANIWRSFGSMDAVRDVSFTLPTGQTLGLLGPNGAGKTTTMRIVLGIYAPDRGSVSWRGAPITAPTRKRLGYLPEERGLYGRLRARGIGWRCWGSTSMPRGRAASSPKAISRKSNWRAPWSMNPNC